MIRENPLRSVNIYNRLVANLLERRIPPKVKRNRIPAPSLNFTQPNLPQNIQEQGSVDIWFSVNCYPIKLSFRGLPRNPYSLSPLGFLAEEPALSLSKWLEMTNNF